MTQRSRRLAPWLAGLLLAGCAAKVAPEVLQRWQAKTLYTCCNIHYENPAKLVDANYWVGSLLPFGSPAAVQAMAGRSITFRAAATDFTLTQAYGTEQESAEQYFAKVLVETDPRLRFASFSPSVQAAITEARVEIGMTREQVLMSLGYPPTHRTASIDQPLWIYWYNRWLTYTVQFGADGLVARLEGRAPTNGQAVQQAVATPTPAPARRGKR